MGGSEPGTDPAALALPPEAMRELGYRVVDLLVDHWENLPDEPAGRRADRPTLEALLSEPAPRLGRDPAEVLERLRRDVLDHRVRVHHPRFYAFVPGPANFVGVLGEFIAAGHNVFAGTWFGGSGPAMLELVTLGWLRELCGMPESAAGVFTSGGSMANLVGLAVARKARLADRVDGAVAYASDQTHSAVARALTTLGFAPGQLESLPADDGFRLDPATLLRAVRGDRDAGRTPFCVIANAGTTNTGAVDPLDRLADLCAAEGLWLHVDGAYGGAAVLCDRGRAILTGMERADSLALDPHKWLFQPFEMGCVLVRDGWRLPATFGVTPDYLRDVRVDPDAEVHFADRGVQLTRSFRALKLWLSIQIFGVDAFRDAVLRGIDNAERVEALLREGGSWRIVSPARLGIVTFRWEPPGAEAATVRAVNEGLVEATLADGTLLVSSTTLGGETVIRMCPINPRTTDEDLRRSVERLGELAGALAVEG